MRMLDLKGMREDAKKELSALGLLTIQDMSQAVETLSGGQRQGVAVARAAAFGQRVVIMDEPTAALGVKESQRVLQLIRDVRDRDEPQLTGFNSKLYVIWAEKNSSNFQQIRVKRGLLPK